MFEQVTETEKDFAEGNGVPEKIVNTEEEKVDLWITHTIGNQPSIWELKDQG